MSYPAPIGAKEFERLVYRLFLGAFFLMPLELPLAERNGPIIFFFGRSLSQFFYVGHVVLVLSLLLIFSLGWERIIGQIKHESFWGLSVLYLGVGMLGVLFTVFMQHGNAQFSIQQMLLGYMAPVACCGAILACEPANRRKLWLAFYLGWIVFFVWSLVYLRRGWQSAVAFDPIFANASFGQRLFLWRFTFSEPWNLYALFVGNANKTSNNILIFLLLSGRLLEIDADAHLACRAVHKIFGYLGTLTLVILFSRATLFLLPLVIYISGFWRTMGKPIKALGLAGLAATLFMGWASYRAAFNYLLTSTDEFGGSEGTLGTFNDRFGQWSDLSKYLQEHPQVLALGMGTGGYGSRFFLGDEIRGTHNMFLDVLTESGIFGLGLLLGTLLLALIIAFLRSRKGKDHLPLVGLLCLTMLMFREHSPAYLYVTSLGGLCFTVLFYLLSCAKAPEISPRFADGLP